MDKRSDQALKLNLNNVKLNKEIMEEYLKTENPKKVQIKKNRKDAQKNK